MLIDDDGEGYENGHFLEKDQDKMGREECMKEGGSIPDDID